MELTKKMIHTSSIKPCMSMQTTLDDDFNVPDSKADVERLITTRGEIEITEVEALTDKIRVAGACHFYVLYTTNQEQYPISSLEGSIPLEQIINCDGTKPIDTVKVKAVLEDLNISIINSRKLSIRCLINLHSFVGDTKDYEAAAAFSPQLPTKMEPMEPDMQCLYKDVTMTTLKVNKKDIFRVKEEIKIPSGKAPIYEILWSETTLSNMETRLMDGKLLLNGELSMFLLYQTLEESMPIQFFEMDLPIKGELPVEDVTESMLDCVEVKIASTNYTIRPNEEGEDRIFEVECTLDLDIRIYEEESMQLLSDIYSPNAECKVEPLTFPYVKLLQKNQAKTRISQKMKLKDAKDSILQIAHINGTVKLDALTPVKDGVNAEGVVTADILYASGSDAHPFNSTFVMVPFSYLVEMDGMKETDQYEIVPHLDQISINMIDSDEVELKAVLSLSAIAFTPLQATLIKDVLVSPLDAEKMQKMPGMVGYVVKPGDTLWSIAKTYYTTKDNIVLCNELENEMIEAGDKLIIVK